VPIFAAPFDNADRSLNGNAGAERMKEEAASKRWRLPLFFRKDSAETEVPSYVEYSQSDGALQPGEQANATHRRPLFPVRPFE